MKGWNELSVNQHDMLFLLEACQMAKYAVLWWSISFQFKWVYFQRGDKCHAAIKRLGSISIIEEKSGWLLEF